MSPTPQTPHGIKSPAKNRVMRSLAVAGVATAMLAGPVAAMAQNNLTIKATACYDVQAQVLNSLNTNNDGTTKDGDAAIKSQKNDYQKFLEDVVLADENTASTKDANAVAGDIQTKLGTVADGAMVSINVVKVGDTYYYAAAPVADPTDVATEDQSAATEISSDISEKVQAWADKQEVTVDLEKDVNELPMVDGITLGAVNIPAADLQVEYVNAGGTGEATARMTYAKDSTLISGAADITYDIAAKDLTDAVEIAVDVPERTYTGSEIKPTVTVKHKATQKPIPATDYELSYEDNVDAGTGTIHLAAKGDLTGCTLPDATFTITPAQLSTVKGLDAKTVAFQEAKRLDFKLTFNGAELDGDDYTVSGLPAGFKSGNYTVTLTGKGNFAGTAKVDITVSKPSLNDVQFSNVAELPYNGNEQDVASALAGATAEIPATEAGGDAVACASDQYEVVSNKQVDAGVYDVTVKPTHTSDWIGTKTVRVTMNKMALNEKNPAEIRLEAVKNPVFNGKEQMASAYKLTFRAADGETWVEVPASDYKVTAKDGVSYVNAGDHEVEVTILKGSKNLKGYVAGKSFTIDKLDLATCTVDKLATQPLGIVTASNLPKTTVKDADGNVVEGLIASHKSGSLTEATANVTDNEPVVITLSGDGVNTTGSIDASFELAKMNVNEAKPVTADYEYSNSAPTQAWLEANTDLMLADTAVPKSMYSVSYADVKEDHVNVGTKKININGQTDEFQNGTLSATFKVVPFDLAKTGRNIPVNYAGATTVEYAFGTNTPAADEFSVADPGLGLKDENGQARALNGDEVTITVPSLDAAGDVEVTATGKGNFTGTISKIISVDPLELRFENTFGNTEDCNADISVSSAALKDGKAEAVPVIVVTLADGTQHVVSEDEVKANFDLVYENNEAPGTATVTVKEKADSKFTLAAPADVNGYKLSFEVTPEVKEGVVTSYRLYNANNGDHFFTYSAAERDGLIEAGWKYEGVAWEAPASSSVSVYRFYDPNTGEHFYTANKAEAEQLKTTHWRFEGEQLKAPENGTTPIYRVKNPGANKFHHFTAGLAEYNMLKGLGWADEGIAWYV